MQIVILSDIHDNVWKLAVALNHVRSADVLICCGDLCSPFVASLLAATFPGPIHAVAGNNEGDWRQIMLNVARANKDRDEANQIAFHGQFFEKEFDGKRFAVNHYPDIALALAASGRYDVVCYGHNHQFKIEQLGPTLTINPGALMGYNPLGAPGASDIHATFVIYDTTTGQPSAFRIEGTYQALQLSPFS